MDLSLLADLARIVMLIVAVVLGLLAVKFGHAGIRSGGGFERVWVAATFVLLLATASVPVIARFGEPLHPVTAAFALALVCGVVTVRKMYTVHPEWTRTRLASEREQIVAERQVVRDEQDSLRTEDRVFQAGERADSRDMFDAGHLHESVATYDRRVEAREAQDENREHSHQLQDDERKIVRDDEDERT